MSDHKIICAKGVITEHDDHLDDEFYKTEKRGRVKSEIDCLMAVHNHPNIVEYIDYAITKKNKTVWIFMELCQQGDLHLFLTNRKRQLDYKSLLSFMTQAADAVSWLHNHDKQIIHRDIKTKNFLIQDDTIKLCDFGLSKLCDVKNASRMYQKTCAGTMAFMAPELLMTDVKYDCSVDIFSLGLVFSVLIKYQGKKEHLMPKSGMPANYR